MRHTYTGKNDSKTKIEGVCYYVALSMKLTDDQVATLLPTTLLDQVEHSVGCACACVQTITFELSNLFMWMFGAVVHLDSILVKVEGQCRRSKFMDTGGKRAQQLYG